MGINIPGENGEGAHPADREGTSASLISEMMVAEKVGGLIREMDNS